MKGLPYLLICIVLASVLLTAGCLDDLSSTLPPCYDGTCNMTKTSVITVMTPHYGLESSYDWYIHDSDDIIYGLPYSIKGDVDRANDHNVTFSYTMLNGHRRITGIIEDHDAKPKCEYYQCNNCCQCGGCSQCGTK